jgi:hypothetical protein
MLYMAVVDIQHDVVFIVVFMEDGWLLHLYMCLDIPRPSKERRLRKASIISNDIQLMPAISVSKSVNTVLFTCFVERICPIIILLQCHPNRFHWHKKLFIIHRCKELASCVLKHNDTEP